MKPPDRFLKRLMLSIAVGGMDAEPEDLEGLAGSEHFGFIAGWVYGDGCSWPPTEVRPTFVFGMIQEAIA